MISVTCPECGAPCKEDAEFCPECGISLTPANISPGGGVPPAERLLSQSAPVAQVTPRIVRSAYPQTLPNGVIAEGRSRSAKKGCPVLLVLMNIVSIVCFLTAAKKITDQVNAISQAISAALSETESVLNGIVDTINSIPVINIPLNFDLNENFTQAVLNDDKSIAVYTIIFFAVNLVVIPAIMIFACIDLSRGYRIKVTREYVEGKIPLGGSVKMPVSCITDVKTDILGNIAVYCFGKRFVFKEIDNSDGVFRAIRDLTAGNVIPQE